MRTALSLTVALLVGVRLGLFAMVLATGMDASRRGVLDTMRFLWRQTSAHKLIVRLVLDLAFGVALLATILVVL